MGERRDELCALPPLIIGQAAMFEPPAQRHPALDSAARNLGYDADSLAAAGIRPEATQQRIPMPDSQDSHRPQPGLRGPATRTQQQYVPIGKLPHDLKQRLLLHHMQRQKILQQLRAASMKAGGFLSSELASLSKGNAPLGLRLKKSPSFQKELSELSSATAVDGGGSVGGVAHQAPLRGPFGGLSESIDTIRRTGGRGGGYASNSKGPLSVNNRRGIIKASQTTSTASTMQQRLKASNFPASTLQIGSWKRVAVHEGEIIAKCYYAKRKLVWEVLQESVHNIKNRIEISWDDITSFKFSTPRNRTSSLEIKVGKSPEFSEEAPPQPRRHTPWHKCDDFTYGQASACRTHRLLFAPGVLNKHVERLMQCDKRLCELAKQGQQHPLGSTSVGSNSLLNLPLP